MFNKQRYGPLSVLEHTKLYLRPTKSSPVVTAAIIFLPRAPNAPNTYVQSGNCGRLEVLFVAYHVWLPLQQLNNCVGSTAGRLMIDRNNFSFVEVEKTWRWHWIDLLAPP